jgi:methylenetetrahydrofolate--tRNA-(uracil-5-)-methyltransferase
MAELMVIGGGLAGSEAAWQAAELGIKVDLYEMRPQVGTGAHTGGDLAELVCSNSLGTLMMDRAPGLLKEELLRGGSLLMRIAQETAIPAGSALAVDRTLFARRVTEAIEQHPNIRLVREEVTDLPGEACIVASGPLTSSSLSRSIAALTGQEHLYFFDAIAPVVTLESINFDSAFRATRYEYEKSLEEGGDYINCPLSREQYNRFIDALLEAERIQLKGFELEIEMGVKAGPQHFFEGCLPVEILARRGREALAFGPMRPIGLHDPRTGFRPYAVAQLRQDNVAATLYNIVGFQTNLTFPEQKRVLRMIPGLENAEFARYGQMHRNTFIFSPSQLLPTLQHVLVRDVFFAGQITGVEGYTGNIATGMLAGWNAARVLRGQEPLTLPLETMLGALCHYITHASPADFQPMKANFSLLPPLDNPPKSKKYRHVALVERALKAWDSIEIPVRK